eukprot:403337768
MKKLKFSKYNDDLKKLGLKSPEIKIQDEGESSNRGRIRLGNNQSLGSIWEEDNRNNLSEKKNMIISHRVQKNRTTSRNNLTPDMIDLSFIEKLIVQKCVTPHKLNIRHNKHREQPTFPIKPSRS